MPYSSNWTRAHNHVLTALESICNSAGYATKHKHVLTSAGKRRADLEILNIEVAQNIDLSWTSPCVTTLSALGTTA